MIVASDGCILFVLCPYLPVKPMSENIQDWYEEGDVIVVDGDFRDVPYRFEECGVKSHIPHFIENH